MPKFKNALKKANVQRSNHFYGVLFLLWALLLVISLFTLSTPLNIEEKNLINNIIQKTYFDYSADLLPSLLHPNGGTIEGEGPIFTNITKTINLHIDSRIIADKPVKVEGTYRITCRLISENSWEHDYYLRDEQRFELEGTDNTLIDGQFSIPIEDILSFFDDVEQELGTYSDGYIIKITPELNGIITYGDEEIPIDSSSELTFRLSSNILELVGDKEFISETPIYNSRIVENSFNIMGKTVPIKAIRIISTIPLLLLTIYLSLGVAYKIKLQRNSQSELDKIIKKYGKRLVYLKKNIKATGHIVLELESFEDMIRISEEKDLPLLFYFSGEGKPILYVIESTTIYSYMPETVAVNQKNEVVIGKDLFYVQ